MSITTTGTGNSSSLRLGEGEWVLLFSWAGSAGSATLEVGQQGVFGPANLNSEQVTIEGSPAPVRVIGGLEYRVNVATHTSALTIVAIKGRQ